MTAATMTASAIDGTVIFSDLVGFTEFNGARGDVAAVEVLDRHRALMDEALAEARDGRVVKELGDGLLVWSPSAAAGMRVATGFLDGVLDARSTGEFPLAVRIGVHHGTMHRRGDDIVGQTVNIAARIVNLAGPGEILLSDAVLDGSGHLGPFAVEPIGPTSVKGVAEAVWLYRIGCSG